MTAPREAWGRRGVEGADTDETDELFPSGIYARDLNTSPPNLYVEAPTPPVPENVTVFGD